MDNGKAGEIVKAASVADLIGDTPMVDLSSLVGRAGVLLLGKLEGHNPGGSVKDRPAQAMIRGALARGEIGPGTRVIEPTSGNTGIALAMIARACGVDLELVMPENSTAERVHTMRAFGARVTLTPAAGGMEAAIDYARARVAEGGSVMLDQFSNPDNWRAHYESTGPEIWRDTRGRVTHFVSSMGTTGTIMGCSRYLKERRAEVEIVGVQPTEGSRIPGIRRWPPAYLPRIFERERVDRIVDVSEAEAEDTARLLARQLGVFVGVSSGGATAAAIRVARGLDDAAAGAAVMVVILCDRGDRYLSSDLFARENKE